FHAEFLPVLERQFKRGAFHVAVQDDQVVRVYEPVLRVPPEEVVRIVDYILVERAAARDEDRGGNTAPAPGTACLLPGTGYRSRVPAYYARFQRTDDDAQFQGIRRYDPGYAAIPQALLYFAAERGQVSAPVAADLFLRLPVAPEDFPQVGDKHLHVQAASRE